MIIEILETFLDGKNRFVAGEIREVESKDGRYFCGCGWARDTSGEVPTASRQANGEVRLDIRDSKLSLQSDEV